MLFVCFFFLYFFVRKSFGHDRASKQIIDSLSFTYTANGKRQIQVKNFSQWKMST